MTAPRVLVGDFGAIGAAGLGAMLDAEGLQVELSGLAANGLLERVAAGNAEVVVLDRGMPQALATAARIAAEHTSVRVIVCSLDETTMSVYPGGGNSVYEAPLDPPGLAAAIRSAGELAD